MKTFKNYLHQLRFKGFIEDALGVKEMHFVKQDYFRNIINTANHMESTQMPDMRKTLKDFFDKYRHNQKQTLRLLMILHQILRETDSFSVSEMLLDLLQDLCETLTTVKDQKLKEIDRYLKKSFSLPYTAYLIKTHKTQNFEEFVENKLRKGRNMDNLKSHKDCKTTNSTKFKPLQRIQTDFQIFNLVTDILKFNSDLHQMGRYYSGHQYSINFYLEMLKDFQVYFRVIQTTFAELTQIDKSQLNQNESEKVYLFMTESERCVNKMNSFYYNKYLFYYVNDKINLKMHLEIPQKLYSALNHSHRRMQRSMNLDICLSATYQGQKMHQPDTRDTNRSKQNNFNKIMYSIASLSQALEQIEQIQKQEMEKQFDETQKMRRSALF